MKLTKEKIIEAAEAFNQANSFDEFKVKLDLCDVQLEDFEKDYYEVASTHPVFASMIRSCENEKRFDTSMYMKLDPKAAMPDKSAVMSTRFKLPLWFERDDFGTVHMMMPGRSKMPVSFSTELAKDLSSMGIDPFKEMAQVLMYELGHI